MRFCRRMSIALLSLATAGSMHAATLASVSPNPLTGASPANYLGESFTVSGTGSYNSVAFDFITPGGSPYAIGTGFLLTQAYAGTPTGLSSATVGYLGSAAASGGYYTFATSVALNANSTYYFYENALAPAGSQGGNFSSGATPEYFYATSGSGNFTAQPGFTAAFQVTGSPVMATTVTPEPSSFALLGTGVLGIAGTLRRRFQA